MPRGTCAPNVILREINGSDTSRDELQIDHTKEKQARVHARTLQHSACRKAILVAVNAATVALALAAGQLASDEELWPRPAALCSSERGEKGERGREPDFLLTFGRFLGGFLVKIWKLATTTRSIPKSIRGC